MNEEKIERFRRDLLEWFEENGRDYPWREPDASVYEVFVAEFFLTQTPADNVASVYRSFVDKFPDPEALREVDGRRLEEEIEPIGFQRMRSRALKEIASERDEIPRVTEELQELPRVGRYVANATLSIALNQRLPLVDRNVDRVYNRLLGDEWPETESKKYETAEEMLPEDSVRDYNLALLDFGAEVCGPEPSCPECFAREYCSYYG